MNGAREAVGVHVWSPSVSGFGGGIGAFSRELVSSLLRARGRVSVVAMHDTEPHWNGVDLLGAGTMPRSLRAGYFGALALAAATTCAPDVIISTHIHFGPVAAMIRRTFGIPYILVAHGVEIQEDLSSARMAALRGADAVWAVSSWTKSRLADVGVDPGRIAIVANTVDTSRFVVLPADAALRRRYGLLEHERVVLTVARLDAAERYKGYDVVIRVLSEIQRAGQVRYLIVGSGDDRTRISDLARSMGVHDRVTFCGFVAPEEIVAHFNLADVFVMPSVGEGFGIVFLEAMACGTPVLGGDRDGTVDALGGGEFGELVDPSDDAAVAAGISRLLSGIGPDWWFSRNELRSRMLARFGRPAFDDAVSRALYAAISHHRMEG